MKKYKSVLTERAKLVFKGGNIKPMKKGLISFEAENNRKAEDYFYNHILEILGSASRDNYKLIEVEAD